VNVGEKAFVAAGTTVTKDVPAKSLTIGRNKQLVKENWAKKNGLVD
jgi:bifunctional UDP-N-acetylglucosamine pyrophosphorylase/glucosamine-1-phosphate N-acetyltransferase